MEPKAIIYIVGGIIYFLYTLSKKAQEKRPATPQSGKPVLPAKPVAPPTGNPMDDILREIKRKQAELEQRKKVIPPQPLTAQKKQTEKPAKELFVHEKKKATFGQGAADAPYESTADEQKILKEHEAEIKEGAIYKILTAEETIEAEDAYRFDARQAFIGSVIFEKKY